MNINELMQRREQINEDIQRASNFIKKMKAAVHEFIENHDFYLAELNSGILLQWNKELTIMLEQNVTIEEAKAIIAAQSEEPAAAEPKQEEPKQEEPEQFAGLNLTEKETATLNALIKGLYAEAGFTDVTDLDLVNATGIPAKSMRGVLSSLSKKGIIDVDTSAVEDINFQRKMEVLPKVTFNSFINLTEEYYSLHPEWAAEIA